MSRRMKDSGVEWIGEIPEDWKLAKIKNLFNVISGSTPSSSVREYWDGNIRWITPSDMRDEGMISGGARTITEKGYDSCGTQILPANSIVISNRAPIGKVNLTTYPLCTNQGCKGLVREESSNIYFYYSMLNAKEMLVLLGRGTTFLELSTNDLEGLAISVPPSLEQHKIATYLDQKTATIDHIIEKTKESIEDYKLYKQSLISEAVTKGLNPDVKLKDSGVEWIGEIPEHWNTIRAKYMFSVVSGNGFPEHLQGRNDESLMFLKVSDINDPGIMVNGANNTVSKEEAELYRWNVIKPFSILMPKIGEALKKNYRKLNPAPCMIDNNMQALEIIGKQDPVFSYYLWLSIDAEWFDNKGTVPSVNNFRLLNNMIPNVPYKEQGQIVAYLDKMMAIIDVSITRKEQLIEELEAYKKSLIFEVVTGKREV